MYYSVLDFMWITSAHEWLIIQKDGSYQAFVECSNCLEGVQTDHEDDVTSLELLTAQGLDFNSSLSYGY